MSFTPAGGPQSVTEVVSPRPNLDLSDKYFKLPEKSSFEDMARGFNNEKIYRFRRGSRTFHQWVILFAGEGCPSLLLVLLIFQKFLGGIGSGQRRLINKNT